MKPPTIAELKSALKLAKMVIDFLPPEAKKERREQRIVCLAIKRWLVDKEAFVVKRAKQPKPKLEKVSKPYLADCNCGICRPIKFNCDQ